MHLGPVVRSDGGNPEAGQGGDVADVWVGSGAVEEGNFFLLVVDPREGNG